ncbi:MAG: hypothetical protein HY236_08760, partial [Acidobacteria bacterium]|nr:hypothetical protein [Acidobacteriota bacterium]
MAKNRSIHPLLVAAASPFQASPAPGVTHRGSRSRVDLNGPWERYLNGSLYDVIQAPGSLRPLGSFRLQRSFLLPKLAARQRAFLCFDAVTYHGRAFANGTELGAMGSYVPYEFEFTRHAEEGSNTVEVVLSDLIPEPSGAGKAEIAVGLNPGWEGYGGIIRDVYVELRPGAFIENIRFAYKLNGGYTKASCRAQVFLSAAEPASGRLELSLFHGHSTVARLSQPVELPAGSSEVEAVFDTDAPPLWSPEQPNLHQLAAHLETGLGADHYACRTGFRDLQIRGRAFELNGRALVLNGVCRHDMWKDQGFTLTPAQMEQDMRMIKALGANFVRLVHYPHHRYIIDLADELGLLVSEEPGYWNMDFQTMPRAQVEAGLRILERIIRRDWNSPAVFAWLLANECN